MSITIQENVALAPYTTFGVGGPARYFCRVTNEAEIGEALTFAKDNALPLFVLGGGSNLVVHDDGFSGLVIKLDITGVLFEKEDDETVCVIAAAGENWDQFVGMCVDRGLAGLENLSGIPGTVGAAPVQNIGAYGTEIKDTCEWVEVLNTQTYTLETLPAQACRFAYRTSIFKQPEGAHYIVLRVAFRLSKTVAINLSYQSVQRYFQEHNRQAQTLQDIRQAVLTLRAERGMVLTTGEDAYKTAGSFFKNPIVSSERYTQIARIVAEHYASLGEARQPWSWDVGTNYKLSAAFLMECAGFSKETYARKPFRERVGLSPKHSLAITNVQNATAQDIFDFMHCIQRAVHERFGVTLEPEVRFVGDFKT